MRAKFIVFEGAEGAGKSTALEGAYRYLQSEGVDCLRTREPGGSAVGERLRAIFLDPDADLASDTEILTVFAARAQHMQRTILPALERGQWVLCDRFVDSTVAYQGFGRFGGDADALAKIELLTRHFAPRLPDLRFWLDVDLQEGLRRAARRDRLDRVERENAAFFERVRQGFLYQYQKAQRDPNNASAMVRVDANAPPEAVLQTVIHNIQKVRTC